MLILDPTYGEYIHVLERVIGCRADRLILERARDYRLDLERLAEAFQRRYDLIALVNPNSPTGQHVPKDKLLAALRQAPASTRIWIDETYVEYAGRDQSLEAEAAVSPNLVVCKSMSKIYALSGARAAYLCARPGLLEELRGLAPPWAVSLPAQVAAIEALKDPAYYEARIEETRRLRAQLLEALRPLPWDITPGIANFLLCHLRREKPGAAALAARCRERGLFVRDASTMGGSFGDRAVRIAVKDAATNERMARILRDVFAAHSD